jgi:hypothetical protein
MKPEKIAFRLNSDKAVEYANAHSKNGAGRYELCNDHYFHLPHFDVYEGLYGHSALTILPGYTDVTPNFLEDYYRPWKDKLASDNAPSISPLNRGPFGDNVPIFPASYVKNMRDGFVATLKVLRTMMEAGNLEAGVTKCDELLKEYTNP